MEANAKTWIDAIYEGGAFKPIGPVDLPEGTRVQVYVVETPEVRTDAAPTAAQAEIYKIMSHRFNGGHTDTAERHNEHQP